MRRLYAAAVMFFLGAVGAFSAATPLGAPRWQLVANGQAAAQPLNTSYGFLLLTDGRTLVAYTLSGKVFWQYSFAEKPDFFTADEDDFVYAVSGGKKVLKLNPSGALLWKADAGEPARYPPLPGRDGRVFVATGKSLLCFDTRGRRRWRLEIPAAAFPPLELNDGSLLVIEENHAAMRESKGVRISPYGEFIEEITFSGKITGAAAVDAGVLLTFSAGMYGLCAVKGNRAYSAWTGALSETPAAAGPPRNALPKGSGSCAAIIFPEGARTGARFISLETGKAQAVPAKPLEVNMNELRYGAMHADTLVLSDSAGALAVRAEASRSVLLWDAALPQKSGWNFIAYSPQGLLFVCGTDWVASAYRVHRGQKKTGPVKKKTYQEFVAQTTWPPLLSPSFERVDAAELDAMATGLSSSDCGVKELEWQERLLSLAVKLSDRYAAGGRIDNSELFPVTLRDTALLVQAMGHFGSNAFCKTIARTIRRETDPVMLRYAITAAAETAYDPEGALLDAVAYVPRKTGDASIDSAHIAACDAVYAICSYMGKRSFVTKGRAIMEIYTSPRFATKVRLHAYETLQKFTGR